MSDWDELTALLDGAPGDFSLCVSTAAGDQLYGYKDDVVRSAASLIKVPLAMALYDRLPATLDIAVTLAEADRVEGEGWFDVARAGTVKTVRELVGHALTESDNTAANLLIDRIGFAAVNGWLAALGLQTRLQRKFMDFAALAAGRDNITTAADMCRLFQRLTQPPYVELLGLLKRAVGTEKLEHGLPSGTAIAHKVGDLPQVEHDVGIIFAPGAPYIVAALAVNLQDMIAGRKTIARASRLVWQAITGRYEEQLRQGRQL